MSIQRYKYRQFVSAASVVALLSMAACSTGSGLSLGSTPTAGTAGGSGSGAGTQTASTGGAGSTGGGAGGGMTSGSGSSGSGAGSGSGTGSGSGAGGAGSGMSSPGVIVTTADGTATQASGAVGSLLGGVLQTAGNAVLTTSDAAGAAGASTPLSGVTTPVTGTTAGVGAGVAATGTALKQNGLTATVNGATQPLGQVASVTAAGQSLVGGQTGSPIAVSALSPNTAQGTVATIGGLNGNGQALNVAAGAANVASVTPSGVLVGPSAGGAPLVGANVLSNSPASGSIATVGGLSGGQVAGVNASTSGLNTSAATLLATPVTGGTVSTPSVSGVTSQLTSGLNALKR
jgi:hypothetical protein